MNKVESIQQFCDRLALKNGLPERNNGAGHFNVFPRQYCSVTASYHRRDFYKITLITEGTGIIHYADKEIVVDRPGLFFSNPQKPHSWEATSEKQEGWFCVFTEEFIQSWNKEEYPICYMNEDPIIFLTNEALEEFAYIYRKMAQEMSSNYIYKYSELRNYLQLIIHEAVKNYPEVNIQNKQIDAAHRITLRFLELLEQQFPIENTDMPLKLRSAQEYAEHLSVHEYHLNHSLKEVTGKNASLHIAQRIVKEAKALLKNTDWSIAEIAYSLRFEYPSHFTSFFKKNTGNTPKEYRNLIL